MSHETEETMPSSDSLAIRVLAMPKDTNPNGDVFGGWLVSLMDMAGATAATHRASGRVVTIAIEALTFIRPVFVGDEVSCFTTIQNIGKTSIKVHVDVWVRCRDSDESHRVTEGTFTFVAIGKDRRPRAVPK